MQTPTLLRRHGLRCEAQQPADSYSTESEERRHNRKRCTCKIYAHGTLEGRFKKLATRARDWASAREVLAPYLAAGSWDLPTIPPNPPEPSRTVPNFPVDSPHSPQQPPPGKPRLTIADAVEKYLAWQEDPANGYAAGTRRKTREILGALARYSRDHGLRYLAEWDFDRVRAFRTAWGNRPRTSATKLGRLKPFFEMFVTEHRLD